MFDAIIVGSSFAGLAVANQVRGQRVLLIDRKPVGSGQTSACGTILQVLKRWDLLGSLVQTHDSLCLHVDRDVLEFPSPYPWCTFDYRYLCETLLERSGAEFLQATVYGLEGDALVTSEGAFRARCLVDASGWRAVLASGLRPDVYRHRSMNFGIETILPLSRRVPVDPSALHFWYEPGEFSGGIGWAFPRGDQVGVGVASYQGALPLRGHLESFTRQLTIQPDGLHGTYFPSRLLNPIAENVFVVGDAAGMCIGLTGEGIRPALYFGETCGQSVRRVLEGRQTLAAGLGDYAAFVRRWRPFFAVFSWAQGFLPRLPSIGVMAVARGIHRDRVRNWVFHKYWELTKDWGMWDGAD